MRLTFKEWKMDGGKVMRWLANFGPLDYAVDPHDNGTDWWAITPSVSGCSLKRCDSRSAAEAHCEAHLEAIANALKEGES